MKKKYIPKYPLSHFSNFDSDDIHKIMDGIEKYEDHEFIKKAIAIAVIVSGIVLLFLLYTHGG